MQKQVKQITVLKKMYIRPAQNTWLLPTKNWK